MKKYEATIKDGKLACSELMKDLAHKDVQGMKVTVIVEKWGDKARSIAQNSYLWGVLYSRCLEFYQGNVRAFIEDLMKAVGFALTVEFVHEMFKIWWLGGKSTTKLSTEGMMKYQDGIREYFLFKHKLDIPPPNESPIEELNAK